MCPAFLSDGSRQYNRARKIHPRDPVSQLGYYLSSTTPSSAELRSDEANKAPDVIQGGDEQISAGQWRQIEPQTRRTRTRREDAGSVSARTEAITRYSRSAARLASALLKRRLGPDRATNCVEEARCRDERPPIGSGSGNQTSLFTETSPSNGHSSDEDVWLNLRKRRPTNRAHQKRQGGTLTGSSGYDDELNTQNEGTLVEHYGRPAYQVSLEDANHTRQWRANAGKTSLSGSDFAPSDQSHLVYEKGMIDHTDIWRDFNAPRPIRMMSGDRSSLRKQQLAIARPTHATRMKRRNVARSNRRMLIDGNDHLVNPYALSELFSQSEIPGFREIFASDSYLRKFCWVVAFLFMTVLSLNDITELITEYYEYPITVDLRLRDSARLPFPSVTVCNLNVVRFSALCSFSSTNTNQNPRFKIPSDLRDKLCGIQVEKKNSTSGDTDINDINNIGMVTTPPSTTASGTTETTDGTSQPTGLSSPLAGSTPASAGSTYSNSESPGPTEPLPPQFSKGTTSASKWPSRQVDSGGLPTDKTSWSDMSTLSGGDWSPAEHKWATTTPSTLAASSSTRSNGALDLGDFTEPSLLIRDRQISARRLVNKAHQPRGQRSFRLSEGMGDNSDNSQQRPFAPSRSRIRVAHQSWQSSSTVSRQPMASGSRLHQLGEIASQLLQPPYKVNQGSNNINGPYTGSPAVHGANRNGVSVNHPAPVTVQKSFQNPLGAQSPTTPMSSTSSTPPSTTFVPAMPDDFELTERQERELQENLTNWLAVMHNRDPELTWSLGHQFDDMILRCTMKSINCTHQRSFENSFTPTEGNCFTYRSKLRRRVGGAQKSSGSSGQFEEANLASINHGLELVLNLEKNEYVSGSSQVGALVMVHHPNDLGYAASEATFVAPEFTTYIGLKMVNITRLPAPYPEYCVDSWPKLFAETLTRNSTYSQQACLRICLQTTIQSHCHCQSAFLPIVELDGGTTASHQQQAAAPPSGSSNASSFRSGESAIGEQPQRVIICDTRKQATRQCVREVMLRAADRVHNCECPPKCQVVRYDKTISMARWPTREDRVTFDRGKMDVNFQNLAKVIVYFQTMTCDEVTQQAVFNAAKLFSALGGIMGMYVGFSFLSVFEIFEVMSRKMWHHFSSKLANTGSRVLSNMRA